MHVVGVADLDVARATPASRRRLAERVSRAPSLGDALKSGRTHVTDRRRGADRLPRDRGDRRGDRRSRSRHPPRAEARSRTASTSSWSTSRPTRSPAAAGAQGAERRRGLQPRLGRPAGADLRACRLGARLRLQGGRRRQGHALPAALSPLHARHRVGHPRQVSQDRGPQVDQSEDVQQLRRRHQVGHRDDRGVQRHRPRAAERRPGLSAGDALRARRGLQAEERPAARSRRRASPR